MTRFTTWSLTVLFSAALLATAPSALAVDGTILINQNTSVSGLPGCPNSGFPIIICQPGSYKLSGNLTMNTTNTGNYQAGFNRVDTVILISNPSVVLDLNGFSIIVNNSDPNLGHEFFAVFSPTSTSDVSIKNGVISVNSVPETNPTAANSSVGILLLGCTRCSVEGLSVSVPSNNSAGYPVGIGSESLIRHNRFSGPNGSGIGCPSVIVENSGITNQAALNAAGCAAANNVP